MSRGNAQFKKYMWRFGVAMIAYTGSVVLFSSLINGMQTTPWRYAVALVPIIPTAFALYYQLMAIRSTDELQRRIYSEAFVVSALFTGFATFGYGFFELAGFPRFNTFYYFPLMIGVWGIANAILNRRYGA